MARDPNGKLVGTEGDDTLWGKAIAFTGGTVDNYSDTIVGNGGNDTIFGDLYFNGDDGAEGDTIRGGDGNDIIYGDAGTDEPGWETSEQGAPTRSTAMPATTPSMVSPATTRWKAASATTSWSAAWAATPCAAATATTFSGPIWKAP